jgi:hypothetical protein
MVDTPNGVPTADLKGKNAEEAIDTLTNRIIVDGIKGGVPKEKLKREVDKFNNHECLEDLNGNCYHCGTNMLMPPTIAQLKDEMENGFDKLNDMGEIGLLNKNDIVVIKSFISSHLQKTYEVAEKAGYEKRGKEILEMIEKAKMAHQFTSAEKFNQTIEEYRLAYNDALEDLLADLSTSERK